MERLRTENLKLNILSGDLEKRLHVTENTIFTLKTRAGSLQRKLEICAEGIRAIDTTQLMDGQFINVYEVQQSKDMVDANLMYVEQIYRIRRLRKITKIEEKTGCWRISCHLHPQSSPSTPWDFFVTQILPQHEPSCILSQHEL